MPLPSLNRLAGGLLLLGITVGLCACSPKPEGPEATPTAAHLGASPPTSPPSRAQAAIEREIEPVVAQLKDTDATATPVLLDSSQPQPEIALRAPAASAEAKDTAPNWCRSDDEQSFAHGNGVQLEVLPLLVIAAMCCAAEN